MFDLLSLIRAFGLALGLCSVMLGMMIVGFYAVIYDATIPEFNAPNVPNIPRIYNLGRMNNRQTGVMVGLAFVMSGGVLALLGKKTSD